MASRYSAGLLTSAGSTTLPLAALVGASTIRPRIWEIGVFNTTATAVALKLVRMTTAGTPGTAASATATHVPEDSAAVAAVRGTYTSTGADDHRRRVPVRPRRRDRLRVHLDIRGLRADHPRRHRRRGRDRRGKRHRPGMPGVFLLERVSRRVNRAEG